MCRGSRWIWTMYEQCIRVSCSFGVYERTTFVSVACKFFEDNLSVYALLNQLMRMLYRHVLGMQRCVRPDFQKRIIVDINVDKYPNIIHDPSGAWTPSNWVALSQWMPPFTIFITYELCTRSRCWEMRVLINQRLLQRDVARWAVFPTSNQWTDR